MLTPGMYERLSEWMANVSILFLGVLVAPVFVGGVEIGRETIIRGMLMALGCLWLSLRFSRIAERWRW